MALIACLFDVAHAQLKLYLRRPIPTTKSAIRRFAVASVQANMAIYTSVEVICKAMEELLVQYWLA